MAGNLDFRLNLLANTTGLQQGINGARFAVNALVAAMAAVGVGVTVNGLATTADSYTNLSTRINIATKEGGDFTSAMAGVHQVALMTNSSLDATGSLFARLNAVGKDMGMTQQQALDLTKTINQAIKIGGGSAQASEAAVQQFIQAMQGGVLRGEEFNSIMENGFGVAEALARGLGVTTGELRKMAENGELSAERVVKALQGQASEVQKTYDQFPTTIGNALQRISTSWEILIGKMDQSNGASATVADWLVTIADNMDIVETILKDIGEGFVWVGDQLKKIDPATIEALKTALSSAYETLKEVATTLGEGFEITMEVLNTLLGLLFDWNSGVDTAEDKTNGFTKALQVLDVSLGTLKDGFTGMVVLLNLVAGAAYSAAGALAYWNSKISFGEAKERAFKDFQDLTAKSDEYYQRADALAMGFESKRKIAADEISKTQKQKNAERLANFKKTLEELQAQEEKHKSDYRAISDERIKLNQQLEDARKSGNQSTIDAAVAGLAELDSKEKAYQAESKKITDEKIKAAQDWVNAQLVAADGTQKVADAATQKTMRTTLAAQGLKLEFDSAGKVIVKTMTDAVISTEAQVNATDKARKAAAALGIDLDIALGRVSEKFAANQVHLDNYANGFDELGLKGEQATNALYAGWEKWVAGAKSQVELDAAKAKLLSFGEQGKLSTSQVEMGLQAIKRAGQELPAALSPAEAAMARLGIQSKKQLELAATNA